MNREMDMIASEFVILHGNYWTASVAQYSNKGPLVILDDSKNAQMCRVLVDTVTRRIRLLVANGYTVEIPK